MRGQSLQARFEAKIYREPATGCWLWTGANRGKLKYGIIRSTRTKSNPKGRYLAAHRVAWELYRGPIPDGILICHTCDVHQCVNPSHLFLGTHLDNARDAIAKGRRPSIKLTKSQVEDIKQQLVNGSTVPYLARLYRVGFSNIHSIKHNVIWKDVPWPAVYHPWG